MRLSLVVVVLVFVLVEVQGKNRSRPDGENRRGKKGKGQGRSRSGRSRPLKIRLVPSPSLPLVPNKVLQNLAEQKSQYNVIPVPSSPGGPVTPLTQEEIQSILWREEEEQREAESRLRRKEEEKMRRRKARKEREEKQRALVEERRRAEEQVLMLLVEKEEDEWKRHLEEEERRREEAEERTRLLENEEMRRHQEEEEERRRHQEQVEERRRHQEEDEEKKRQEEEEEERREAYERTKQKEAKAQEAREEARKLQEQKREEEHMWEVLGGLEEEGKERDREGNWLRGDVFQVTQNPAPLPQPPAAREEEKGGERGEEENGREGGATLSVRMGLPPGCSMSDVTVTCDNARMTHFPPLALSQLKSLSLEGNSISSLPEEAFNGIPNLEWINLGKNKLTSGAIGAKAFRGLRFLTRLYLDGNLLEDVPSDLPPTLQELKINENQLRALNENTFRELGSLVILEVEGNHLSEGNVDPRAFSSLRQLSYLRLGRNHFRTVPQGLPSTLLELYLENNMIEEISDTVFNHTSNLNLISLRHNKLDETRIAPMAWINHRHLESIDLSYNELYLVPSYLPRSLVHLVLVGNNIERVPGYVFAHMEPGLEYLYLSHNRLDGEGIEPESFFGSYHSMMELCLDHNQLVTVPPGISEMSNLHFLRLNNNKIRSIPNSGICDPSPDGGSSLVAVRLDNNFINPEEISETTFSCVRPSTGVTLKPQYK